MIRLFPLAAVFLAAPVLRAQDPAPDGLWYLENSTHLVRVLPGGTEVGRIDLQAAGILGFRAFPAPDGRIWLTTSVTGDLKLVEVDGPQLVVTDVPEPAGAIASPASVQFSASGNAWVSYEGGSLQEFFPDGTPGRRITIPPRPADAVFDHVGNLWIAHVVPAGRLSRVDVSTGTVSHVTLPLGEERVLESIRAAPPVTLAGRGFTNGGLWLTDDRNTLLFADLNGEVQNRLSIGAGTEVSKAVIDRSGRAWVSAPETGLVLGISADATGIAAAFNFFPSRVQQLDMDSRGRLLVRLPYSTTNQTIIDRTRIELIDLSSGATRSRIELGLVSASDPARWHHALVTNRQGDADGDGWSNENETITGTSPWDPQSQPGQDLRLEGSFETGAPVTVVPQGSMIVAVSRALAVPTIDIPGIDGELRILPSALVGHPLPLGVRSTAIVPIPNDPRLIGRSFFFQGVLMTVPLSFSAAVDLRVFR